MRLRQGAGPAAGRSAFGWLLRSAAVCAAGLAVTGAARAQNPSPPITSSLKEFTARSISRIALWDLRATTEPEPRDYRITSILLGFAQELTPGDEDLIRRRLEAAWAAGDMDLVLDLTKVVVKLDPRDTVAQLRLITAQISRLQTVELRLTAYDQWLDPEGRGRLFDASIRSRLALDAALLAREQGDEDAFIERLTLATQLDPTHKEAAALAATYAGEGVGMLARLDLLANILLADPVDPNVHQAIARELVIGGAYVGAERFLRNARAILEASGGDAAPIDRDLTMLEWHRDGPGAVIERFNRQRMDRVEQLVRRIQEAQKAGLPIDKLERPDDVRVSPQFAAVQALALDAEGDRPALEAGITEIADTFRTLAEGVLDPEKRPPEVTAEQAERQAADLNAQLQLIRLWTGTQIDLVRTSLDPGGPLVRANPPLLPLLQGWLKLRTGDPAGAIADLTPLADDDYSARIAIGQAHEALGDVPAALAAYDQVMREAPLFAAGAWARARLERLGVRLDEKLVADLEEYARPSGSINKWVDGAVADPRRYVNVVVVLPEPTSDPLQRDMLRLRITNVSGRPLAMGADRAISSRFLIAAKIEAALGPLERFIVPEVLDVDRRLRLMSGESVEALVWPSAGETGLMLELAASINTRVRWRAIQGFWIDPEGGFRPGPMNVQTESEALVRRSLPEAVVAAGEHVRKVQGDPDFLLPRLAAGLRAALMTAPPPEPGNEPMRVADEAVGFVADAWVARWPNLSPEARAMAAAVLPTRQFSPAMAPVEEAMRLETDPLVLAVVLVTRVTEPDDALLSQARAAADPRIAELATLLTDRLATGAKTYARLTPKDLMPAPKADADR